MALSIYNLSAWCLTLPSPRISVAERGVDEALELLPLLVAGDVASDERPQFGQRHLPCVGDVGSDDRVVELPQRVTLGEWLGIRYIQSGTSNGAAPERSNECVRLDQPAAPNVYDPRVGLHQRQVLRTQEPVRFAGKRGRHHDVVGVRACSAVDGP